MPTKETNPCENALSAGGLALSLALAPRTVRVDLNKLKTLTDPASALFTAPFIRYAIEGFLANGSPDMPYDLFGRIISELHTDPHDILPDPPKQETTPTPEWSAEITVDGDRLKMTVRHNGEELVYGKSYVQDTDDLGMMQAISYAAHMCYKWYSRGACKMAKRINSGYMSGYFNHGSLHTRDMNPPQGHERPREIDADTNVCLTCNRPADRCTGKCKAAKGGKQKHE